MKQREREEMISKCSSLAPMGNKKAAGSVSIGNGRRQVFKLCICLSILLASARGSVVHKLRDSDGHSIVSEGSGRFELGFFTPQGSSDDAGRYVGIWYHGFKPEVVVWVANRNHPLPDNNGTLSIKDGNLVVLASNGTSLWSTDLQLNSTNSKNTKMVFMASGNLVLKESGLNGTALWQSFQNPTDTFLPGMNMSDGLKLTSWKTADDPSPGNFTFLKDTGSRYIIERHGARYWVSKDLRQNFNSERTDGLMAEELINFWSQISIDDAPWARAVMTFSGEIQFLGMINNVSGKWGVLWNEPGNICSVVSACGAFASCRSDTRHTCRCLPGFEPKNKDEWNSGDYSRGCQRKSEICSKEEVKIKDFLPIYMNPEKASSVVQLKYKEENCETKCLESCKCQAYSEIVRNRSSVSCAIWEDEIQSIWEYADDGGQIHVRVNHSDIGTLHCSYPTYEL